MGNSFSMTYACKYCWQSIHLALFFFPPPTSSVYQLHKERLTPNLHRRKSPLLCAAQTRGLGCELNCCAGPRRSHLPFLWSQRDFALNLCSIRPPGEQSEFFKRLSLVSVRFPPPLPSPLFTERWICIDIKYICIERDIKQGKVLKKNHHPMHSRRHNNHVSYTSPTPCVIELCLNGYLFFNFIHFEFACVCASWTLPYVTQMLASVELSTSSG